MAIWDTFLLFECGTAIENGSVKSEASSFFSDHQQWLAAFLVAFPEVAVVPQSNERDASLALISTSQKPSMWKIEGSSLPMAVAQSPAGDRAKLLFALAASLSAQTGKKVPPIEERRGSRHSLCCHDLPLIPSYFQMQPRRIETDRRRVGHIQRLDSTRHVEPCKCADGFACLLPQPLALGAQHQRHLVT